MDFTDSEALNLDKDNSMGGSGSELSPAHQAAADGDMDLLAHAIQTDPVLLECTDAEGYVPLAHAVMAERLDSVKLLLKMGASVNRQDNMGRTCLAMAAYQGWYEGVITLLRRGARQAISDKYSRLPLHCATYKSDTRVLCRLLQNLTTTEINAQDNEGMTALHWSAFHDRPEHIKLLLDRGADGFSRDIDGKTVLHWAAQNGSASCSRILGDCYRGNKLVNQFDYSGKAAIHFSAASGHAGVIYELAGVKGCELEIEDPDGRTPLHWAAAGGQAECVRTLLGLDVRSNPVDSEGGTPLDYARQSGCQECVRLTEERLGTETYSRHLVACDGISRSHISDPRKNPFDFILNLFKSRRTEKSPKAKFVHREEVNDCKLFNGDSVFDDSNDNKLETMNLNVGKDRTRCRSSPSSSPGGRRRGKKPENVSSPDDAYLNVYDTKNAESTNRSSESPDDARRPHLRRAFAHSSSTNRASTQKRTNSTQRLVVSRLDNPHMRHNATSDWDPDDTDTIYDDDHGHDSESDMYLIRSPPPAVTRGNTSPRQHKHTRSFDCEKTDARGGAVDKLLVHRSDVASIACRGTKGVSDSQTRESLPQVQPDGSVLQLAPIRGPVPPPKQVTSPSSLLDRRLEALRGERSGPDRPPTPPDWRIPPMDRSASFPMSPANIDALFPAHGKKKRNRQLLLLKQSTSFDSYSDKESETQSSASLSNKSYDRSKVVTSQIPADFHEHRHSMDKSIKHLLH